MFSVRGFGRSSHDGVFTFKDSSFKDTEKEEICFLLAIPAQGKSFGLGLVESVCCVIHIHASCAFPLVAVRDN